MISGIIEAGLRIIEKVIPDPAARDAAKLRLIELQQQGSLRELEAALQVALAQTEVNKAEATSSDPYVRRWRPTVGWVCCLGLFYQFLAQPLLAWASPLFATAVPPALDTGDLISLLLGLLGLGGYRTVEKLKGVS